MQHVHKFCGGSFHHINDLIYFGNQKIIANEGKNTDSQSKSGSKQRLIDTTCKQRRGNILLRGHVVESQDHTCHRSKETDHRSGSCNTCEGR